MIEEHFKLFNDAVRTGDFGTLIATFHPDIVMRISAQSFEGRDAVAAAYRQAPPDDTMRMLTAESIEDGAVVGFAWDRGGTGAFTLHRRDGLIDELSIIFDPA